MSNKAALGCLQRRSEQYPRGKVLLAVQEEPQQNRQERLQAGSDPAQCNLAPHSLERLLMAKKL